MLDPYMQIIISIDFQLILGAFNWENYDRLVIIHIETFEMNENFHTLLKYEGRDLEQTVIDRRKRK